MKHILTINENFSKCVLCIALLLGNLLFQSIEVSAGNYPLEYKSPLQVQALSASIATQNLTCNGGADGSITFTNASGGSGNYEYSINGGSTWQSGAVFANLSAGPYHAMLRDAPNPIDRVTVANPLVLTQPAQINASVSATPVSGCYGSSNGSIAISSPMGGSGTYQGSIDGGITWSGLGAFTGITVGTYNIQLRDAANTSCRRVLNSSLVLTQPAQLSANITNTNVTGCHGGNSGSITLSSTNGGTGTYQFSINGGLFWSSSRNFTGLPAGTYDVRIRDAASTACIRTLNAVLAISQPEPLNANVSSSPLTACGSNDGSIIVSNARGGNGTYQYSINGGLTWHASGAFQNLNAGNYNVQIRDAANLICSKSLNTNLVLTQPSDLNATISASNVTACTGNTDGSIQVANPTGGSGSFEYSLNNSAWVSSTIYSSLSAGIYNVQIRDANNTICYKILDASLRITEPAPLAAEIAVTHVQKCSKASEGSISINGARGGSGSYQYSISGGAYWSSANVFTNLSAGAYQVFLRDASSPVCVKLLSNNVMIAQPLAMSASVTSTDESCQGSNNGTITISSATGGTGVYQYSVNNGATWGVTHNYNFLRAGVYDVVMRDKNSPECTVAIDRITINYTEPIIIKSLDIVGTCPGKNTGSAFAQLQGGTVPYTIIWTGNQYNSESFSAKNLYSGNYSVLIQDSKGCVQSQSFFVPTINCTKVHMSPIYFQQCKENSVTISYTLDQPFNADNKVKVFITDSLANFANGKFIDSIQTQQSGSITISLQNIPVGKKYRFRIYTTSPVDMSEPSQYDIQILSKPSPATIIGPMQKCVGSEARFKSHGAANATSYKWYDYRGQVFPYDTLHDLSFTVSSEMQNTVMVKARNACGISELTTYHYDVAPLANWPLITTSGITLSAARALNYQWYMDGVPIPNGNSQTITALKNGRYYVIINNDICNWPDSLEFNAISYDEINRQLTVPEIAEATYEWYFNDQKLSGASDNTIKPTQTGTYKAVVTFNQPSARTSAMMQAVYEFYYEGTVTGVSEAIQNSIDVRPNPGHGTFYLTSTYSLAGNTASLYNNAGFEVASQKIAEGTEAELDFTEVPSGMYYLKVTGSIGTVVRKIVVE